MHVWVLCTHEIIFVYDMGEVLSYQARAMQLHVAHSAHMYCACTYIYIYIYICSNMLCYIHTYMHTCTYKYKHACSSVHFQHQFGSLLEQQGNRG